jgi:hypothetical protein
MKKFGILGAMLLLLTPTVGSVNAASTSQANELLTNLLPPSALQPLTDNLTNRSFSGAMQPLTDTLTNAGLPAADQLPGVGTILNGLTPPSLTQGKNGVSMIADRSLILAGIPTFNQVRINVSYSAVEAASTSQKYARTVSADNPLQGIGKLLGQ